MRRSSRVILGERKSEERERERDVAFAVPRNKYDANDFLPGTDGGGGSELLRGWNDEDGDGDENRIKTVIAVPSARVIF